MQRSTRGIGGWLLGAAGVLGATWMFRRERTDVAGKLAVVAGGSRGLGLCIARELADRGARVVLLARDELELQRAAQRITARGGEVHHHACDIRDRDQVVRTIEAARRMHGEIDFVFNVAGLLHVGPATSMTHDDMRAAMDTTFWGAVHVVDAVLPSMLARKRGHLVNIASIGGIAPVPWMLPYSAAKSAMMGWSVGLHHDLAPEGIRVTTVAPWLMRTGGPVNGTYKGSARRGAFTMFALADITPGLAVASDRAARAVVHGALCHRAVVHVGLPARLLAGLFGIAPGLVSGVFTTITRMLPRSSDTRGAGGRALARELGPLARRIAEASRARNNQPMLEQVGGAVDARAITADEIASGTVVLEPAE